MKQTEHGAKPGKVTPKKESAKGHDTTADTESAARSRAVPFRFKAAIVRCAAWLAVVFRGVA